MQDLIKEIKIINREKEKIIQKYRIQKNPSDIKEEMHRLELKIETEAPSFEEEKKDDSMSVAGLGRLFG